MSLDFTVIIEEKQHQDEAEKYPDNPGPETGKKK